MSRKTIDDLKLEIDGTLAFDPVRARERHEPTPEKRKWYAAIEEQATLHIEVATVAQSEEEAREKIKRGEYEILFEEYDLDGFGPEIMHLEDRGPAPGTD